MKYTVERIDTKNFHGWVVWEDDGVIETEYFVTTDINEITACMNDLRKEGKRVA